MESFNQLVADKLEKWPTMCGNHRLKVLDHLLVTNGTGYDWNESGSTVVYDREAESSRLGPTRSELHAEAFKYLLSMPDFDPSYKQKYSERTRRSFQVPVDPETDKLLSNWLVTQVPPFNELKKALQGGPMPRTMECESYLRSVCTRPSFYTLSLERYSNVADVDGRADDETLDGCIDVLLGILKAPQGKEHYQWENHSHALIILLEKRHLFSRRSKWPGRDEVLAIRHAADKRQLHLCCKAMSGPSVVDFRRLSDEEYFEYHGLVFDYLAENEIHLVRRYHAYLEWQKNFDERNREKSEQNEHFQRKEFWRQLSLEVEDENVRLSDQILVGPAANYAVTQQTIYATK